MVPKLLIALMVVMACVSPSLQDNLFTFGINLALDATPAETSALTPLQLQAYQGLIIFEEWWNALPANERTPRWSTEPFKVALHIERFSNYTYDDANSNFYLLENVYASMQANSSIDYMFVPVSSPWDIQIRNYTYTDLHIPLMVAIADSSESYYSVPGSYGSTAANILTMTSYLPYLRVAEASTIAVIQANEIYQTELCQGVLDNALLNDLQIVGEWTMPFDYNSWGLPNDEVRISNWTNALNSIIDMDVDALFICDYGLGAEWALNFLREKNWLPKSVTLSTLYLPFSDPTLLDYATTMSSYNKDARFQPQASFYNSSGFHDLVESRWGVAATDVHARATLAGMLYANAIMTAASNATSDVLLAMGQSQYKSFMGTSYFDTSRRQEMLMLVLQLFDSGNTSSVIGPATAAASSLIYPMPTWSQRVFAPKWGSGVEIAGAVIMAVGGAITFAWTIFLIVHAKHKVIYAASPLFCFTILLGSLIVFVAIFSWMPNLISDSVCSLRAWLLPLGFMTMFGSLIAKTDRIHRLYNSRGVSIIVISNLQVALIVLVIVSIQAILSILMITVSKLEAKEHVVDPFRVSLNYNVCNFDTALKVLFGINVGYAGLLLGWGSYLAFRIRKVPISIYDESKVIAFSIYNTAFFGAIVIVIQLAVGNSNRDLTFMITAVCCLLGAGITTCTLFGAKFFAIYRPTSSSRGSTRNTHSSSDGSGSLHSSHKSRSVQETSTNRASSTNGKKAEGRLLEDYRRENERLRKRIRDLKSQLKAKNEADSNEAEMEEQ